VVFTGEVLLVGAQPDAGRTIAILRVLTHQKGVTFDTMFVETGMGDGDCGVTFESSRHWTVFAQLRQGEWWTNICLGTRSIAAADGTSRQQR